MIRDDKTLTRGDRVIGYMGKTASSFTLAWLATHRDRLRSVVVAGHHLSVIVIRDSKGNASAPRSDEDVEAVKQLTFGSARD